MTFLRILSTDGWVGGRRQPRGLATNPTQPTKQDDSEPASQRDRHADAEQRAPSLSRRGSRDRTIKRAERREGRQSRTLDDSERQRRQKQVFAVPPSRCSTVDGSCCAGPGATIQSRRPAASCKEEPALAWPGLARRGIGSHGMACQ
ncbi:hypothetical protein BKA81DRAFT_376002 [Phyllosticta paracitricarpa]